MDENISYKDVSCKENKKLYMKLYAKENASRKKEIQKKYRDSNKDKTREYQVKNQDRIKKRRREYYENNKLRILENCKQYYQKNKSDCIIRNNARIRLRKKDDPLFNIGIRVRTTMCYVFKSKGWKKVLKSEKLLGCTVVEFKKHIESMFEPWMTWDNYGKYNGEFNYGWDLDHIIPISTAKTEDELIKLCHYTNIRPLCSYINRCIKRNKTMEDAII